MGAMQRATTASCSPDQSALQNAVHYYDQLGRQDTMYRLSIVAGCTAFPGRGCGESNDLTPIVTSYAPGGPGLRWTGTVRPVFEPHLA